MRIKIYLDGTFESLSAVDAKAEVAALKADLKTIGQVEKLRTQREAAKKAGNSAKDKDLLTKIKALKKTLHSVRNSSTAIVMEKLAKARKTVTAPKLTSGNKTGDPKRNPTRKKVMRTPKAEPEAKGDYKYPQTKEGIKANVKAQKEQASIENQLSHAKADVLNFKVRDQSATPAAKAARAKVTELTKALKAAKEKADWNMPSVVPKAAKAPAARKSSTKKVAIPKQ